MARGGGREKKAYQRRVTSDIEVLTVLMYVLLINGFEDRSLSQHADPAVLMRYACVLGALNPPSRA